MRKTLICILLAIFAVAIVGCGGEGGGNEVSISISPTNTLISLGASRTFIATVTGCDDTAVFWSIQEGSVGGTITNDGVYTATNTGIYHIVVTSHADPTKTAIATVEVFGGPV